jgi:hypothetical protein
VHPVISSDKVLGVDLGKNILAATSSGKLFGGGKLRYERDRALALHRIAASTDVITSTVNYPHVATIINC